ncbi:MAG: hypothetical protein QXG03_04885 [Halalkalicoccus sp.]
MSVHQFTDSVTSETVCYANWYDGVSRVLVPESVPQAHLDRVMDLSRSNGLVIAEIDTVDGPFMAEFTFFPAEAIDTDRDGDAT